MSPNEKNPDLGEFMPDSGSLDDALQVLLDQRTKVSDIEVQLENAMRTKRIAEETVIEKMIEQGIENFKALGKSVTKSTLPRPSVSPEFKGHQMDWLKEIGAGSLISETVNAGTFGAYIRHEFIENGREGQLPTWINIARTTSLLIRSVK